MKKHGALLKRPGRLSIANWHIKQNLELNSQTDSSERIIILVFYQTWSSEQIKEEEQLVKSCATFVINWFNGLSDIYSVLNPLIQNQDWCWIRWWLCLGFEFQLHCSNSAASLFHAYLIEHQFFILQTNFRAVSTAFSNWQTQWGAPFIHSGWNWYHAATVAFWVIFLVSFCAIRVLSDLDDHGVQLLTLFMPSLSPYTRIRMIRIFHVARSAASFFLFVICGGLASKILWMY